VRDPANAALVNSDPELQQWVRNVKMTAEDVKSKMRNTAAPVFAAQVGFATAHQVGSTDGLVVLSSI
jgi:hypothetical protein